MKKNKIFTGIFTAFLCITISGCSDFLDEKPKGNDVPSKIEHYDGLLNNFTFNDFVYNRNYPDGSTWLVQMSMFHPLMTDELITDEESFLNLEQEAKNAYAWKDEIFINNGHSAEWGSPYQQMYTYNVICNEVMDAEGGSQKQKEAILSEARVARAFNYMMLAQWFGKPYNAATAKQDLCVPIVTTANSIETNFERATVEDVYDFVITELEEACPLLPERATHRLRMSQPAGYMILGRAYMFKGDYDKAVEAFGKAEEALVKSEIKLELLDYNSTITVRGEEIPLLESWGYDPSEPYAWAWNDTYPSNDNDDNTEIVFSKQISPTYVGWSSLPSAYIRPKCFELFQPEDHRLKFFSNMDVWGDDTYPYYIRMDPHSSVNEGADMASYYLNYAECLARTGNIAKAKQLLTTFRKHRIEGEAAEIPNEVVSQNDLVRFCVEERQREYLGLGTRWFDMRRLWNDPLFQDLKQGYTRPELDGGVSLTEKRLVYRIPSVVMEFNKNWVNND